MTTIQEFISENQIEMKATRVQDRPGSRDWGAGASHWLCTFSVVGKGNRKTFNTFFSMGSAYKGAPNAATVLSCVADDVGGAANVDFEEWAYDYGYGSDSRKAERMYQAIKQQERELRDWLGYLAYEALIECAREE